MSVSSDTFHDFYKLNVKLIPGELTNLYRQNDKHVIC